MLIPLLLKKRILNSSYYFLARLSWFTVLLKLAFFKVKDAFKWKVVIKNLEQEAEALKEDKKNPWPEPVYFPMGFLLSAHSWKSADRPQEHSPFHVHTTKGGMAYEVSFLWLFSRKTIGGQRTEISAKRFCLHRIHVNHWAHVPTAKREKATHRVGVRERLVGIFRVWAWKEMLPALEGN